MVQFGNKNIFAAGQIDTPANSGSGSGIFAPTQNGWLTAPVILVLDVDATANAGWWRLSLDRQTLVTTIVYTDVDQPAGMLSWTMTPDKCVVNSY